MGGCGVGDAVTEDWVCGGRRGCGKRGERAGRELGYRVDAQNGDVDGPDYQKDRTILIIILSKC